MTSSDLSFILSNIRRQSPATRARWAESSRNNPHRRQTKRLVIRQWLESRVTVSALTPGKAHPKGEDKWRVVPWRAHAFAPFWVTCPAEKLGEELKKRGVIAV